MASYLIEAIDDRDATDGHHRTCTSVYQLEPRAESRRVTSEAPLALVQAFYQGKEDFS
jgi:hypothetical protein